MTGRVKSQLYSERASLAERCLEAGLTANPELRVRNTAFSALRNLERAGGELANQGGTAGVMALVPALRGQGLLLFCSRNMIY